MTNIEPGSFYSLFQYNGFIPGFLYFHFKKNDKFQWLFIVKVNFIKFFSFYIEKSFWQCVFDINKCKVKQKEL